MAQVSSHPFHQELIQRAQTYKPWPLGMALFDMTPTPGDIKSAQIFWKY